MDRIIILGLRCSGTNYLSELIRINYPHLIVTEGDCGVWKHMWQLEMTDPQTIDILAQSTNTLFIFISRHPFEWLQSFHMQPHQCSWARGMKMHQLLNVKPFQSFTEQGQLIETYNSIFEERNKKYCFILSDLLPRLEHHLLLRYETIRDNPEHLIYLLQNYGIAPPKQFQNIRYYKKEENTKYVPKRYAPLSLLSRNLILKEINWDNELFWGYRKPGSK